MLIEDFKFNQQLQKVPILSMVPWCYAPVCIWLILLVLSQHQDCQRFHWVAMYLKSLHNSGTGGWGSPIGKLTWLAPEKFFGGQKRPKIQKYSMIQQTPIDEAQIEKVFFDTENPNSLICRVWPDLVPYIRAVADVYAGYFLANENKVKAFCNPDERDHRVRLRFWDEYYQACAQDRQMRESNITHGVVMPDTWRQVYLTNRRKLLWVFSQPVNYTTSMRCLLEKGLSRLHEIMDMPLMVRRNGKLEPDVRMITQVLKAFQLVDLRVKGSVVQKMQIDQRSVNVNHNLEASAEAALHVNYGSMSMEQLRAVEAQLDRIEQKRAKVVASLPEGERRAIEMDTDIKIPRTIEMVPDGEGDIAWSEQSEQSEDNQS